MVSIVAIRSQWQDDVVSIEIVLKKPLGGALSFGCAVETCMRECQNPSPGHRTAAIVVITGNVFKYAVLLRVATANITDCIVDGLLGNIEAGVASRAKKHQLPAGDRQVGIIFGVRTAVVDVPPAAAIVRAVFRPALHE